MADTTTSADVVAELRAWLEQNWDPDLTVAQWWERLGPSGWAAPNLPSNAYGKDLPRADAVLVSQEIANFGAVGAPAGLGMLLAAPTIASHGTQEQIDRYIKPIVTGQVAWCQLFSEPGAGSDLAGLTAKAVLDGDRWIINGQKVWTSLGHTADLGMLLARTDPDAPKHSGISWFAFDMLQPGVEIRPLREMTGAAMFNEVFINDGEVGDDALIGDRNDGWKVANTTLANERAGLGTGGASGGPQIQPGKISGNLEKRVGDFVVAQPKTASQPSGERRKPASAAAGMIAYATAHGRNDDPAIRQSLVKLHTLGEIGRLNGERVKATKAAGRDVPGMPNIAKLSMSNVMRLQRDLGLEIAGAQGMLYAYDADAQKVLDAEIGDPALTGVTRFALYAQAPPIYGGTDQIQRNIIGERVLGLPKEPGGDSRKPFSELPKNG